jgi:hypothetical protein
MPVITAKLLKYYDSPLFRHGRTGEGGGLGLAGGVMAAGAVLLGLMLSAVVGSLHPSGPAVRPRGAVQAMLPPPPPAPHPWRGQASRPAYSSGRSASRPARRHYDPRLPSQSGFLIRIPDPPPRPPDGPAARRAPVSADERGSPWPQGAN